MELSPQKRRRESFGECARKIRFGDFMQAMLFSTVSLCVYLAAILFSVHSFYICNRTTKLSYIQSTSKDGSLYLLSCLPRSDKGTFSSSIYLKFDESIGKFPEHLIVDAIFKTSAKTVDIRATLPTINPGFNELLSTSIPRKQPIISQLFITGNMENLTAAQLVMIENTHLFGEQMFIIKKCVFMTVVIASWLYISSAILICPQSNAIEVCLVIFCLILACIATTPFQVPPDLISRKLQIVLLLVKGAFPAANLVSLFGISYIFIAGDNIPATLVISALFIIAESMRSLTSDSFMLSDYFDGNGVVWVFFFSISIASRICLIILVFHYLLYSYIYVVGIGRPFIVLHLIVAVFVVVPRVMQIVHLTTMKHYNSAVDFFCDILSESITSLSLAVLHWPSDAKPKKKAPPLREEGGITQDEFQLARDQSLHLFESISGDLSE